MTRGRIRGDDGNALIEFSYLAVLLMVPLVYVLLAAFQVQRASFGVTEAARQAGRAEDAASGRARADAAAALAMRDQGLTCGGCLSGLTDAIEPDGEVTATVEHFVRLPVLGAFFSGDRAGVRVDATHVARVDRFRPAG